MKFLQDIWGLMPGASQGDKLHFIAWVGLTTAIVGYALYRRRRGWCAIATANPGNVYLARGDRAGAEEMYRKALKLNEELGRKEGMADAFRDLAEFYDISGDLARAEEMYAKALKLNEDLGRKEGLASQYDNLADFYDMWGDLARAEAMYQKSLAIEEKLGRKTGMAGAHHNLGILAEKKGDTATACAHWRRARDLWREIGSPCVVRKTRGDFSRVEERHRISLKIEYELDRKEGMASDHCNLGILSEEKGDMAAACAHWRKACDLWREIGDTCAVEKLEALLREADCPGE